MINTEIVHIMLADDDKEHRMDFVDAFDSLKIKTKIQTVNDGVELMDYLNDISAVIPHLLFLDLNLTKKSGLEWLIKMKKMERLNNLTIVIYSTSATAADIEDTFLNGANIYLKKPTHLTVLKKALSHILTLNWQYHTSGLNRDNYLFQL